MHSFTLAGLIFLFSQAQAQNVSEKELSPKLAQIFYVWAKNTGAKPDPADPVHGRTCT